MIDLLFPKDPLITDVSANLTSDILFSGLKAGALLPVAIILVLFAIDVIGNRIKHMAYQILAITLVMGVLVWLMFFESSPIPGSITMTYLALAFVMTAAVFILNFMKLSPLDYAVLFTAFACLSRFTATWLFGVALQVLYFFIVLLVVCKIRLNRMHGHLFHVWFASMLVSVEWFVCKFLFRYVINMGYAYDSRLEKLFVWGVAMLIIIIANIAVIYAVKRLLRKPFDDINQMGKVYLRVERFFIYTTIAILLFMGFLHCYYKLFSGFISVVSSLEVENLRFALINIFNTSIEGLFNLFTLFAMIIQLSFMIMVFRTTRLKDNLQSKTLESQSLLAYSSELEKNMDDLRSIKHDIKNIFLTMSGFVERSDDVEMQTFYHEKISPFAKDEISKSDLYGKLAAINSEHVKAFLFYKISQALERGISLDLDISPRFSATDVSDVSMDIVDLVRALGILMDNAIEECMKIAHGAITVKLSQSNKIAPQNDKVAPQSDYILSQNNKMAPQSDKIAPQSDYILSQNDKTSPQSDKIVSFAIKNTVSRETRVNGVKPGVSTKGNGRGNGLVIVRSILEKYDCVTLNSYFQEDLFVQNLVIYSDTNNAKNT